MSVLSRAVRGQRRLVLGGSVLGAAHQAGEALVPLVIGVIIDEAISTGNPARLAMWIAVLLGLFVALSLGFRFSLRLSERANELAGHELRMDITAHVLRQGGGASMSGELASIATSDARRVGNINLCIPIAVAALGGLIFGAVMLLRVSVPLGALILVVAPVMLVLAQVLSKPLEKRSGAEQERAARASGVAADLVAGLRVLKGIGAETTAASRYHSISQSSMFAAVRAARAQSWIDGSTLAFTGLFLALIALVGGNLVLSQALTVGQLVAAVGLGQFLLWPLVTLAWVNTTLAQARASARRVEEVLAAPPAVPPGSAALADVRGHLKLDSVAFGPLQDVSLDVRPGSLVGVVAPDPADALALLRVLSRDVDPVSGVVSVDDVPLTSLSAARSAVLVADHDAPLFEGTVASNLRGDVPGALAASCSDTVIEALPDGMETVITDRGRSLSGGQRQRLALARALAAAPPVLVLHDPTTAVDAVTEVAVASGIARMRAGLTTVVVASSPALLSTADHVVLLESGRITASGTHSSLTDNDSYRVAVLS